MTRGGPGHRLGCLWLSPVLAAIQRSLGQPESWPGCAPLPAACRDLDAGLGFLGPWFLRWEERWAGGWRKPLCQLWCRTYSAGTAPSLSSLEAGSLSLAGRETEVQPMPTQRWQGRGWAQGWELGRRPAGKGSPAAPRGSPAWRRALPSPGADGGRVGNVGFGLRRAQTSTPRYPAPLQGCWRLRREVGAHVSILRAAQGPAARALGRPAGPAPSPVCHGGEQAPSRHGPSPV